MKNLNLFLWLSLIIWACSNQPPLQQPPSETPKLFEMLSDNSIQTIYSSETAEFKLEIRFLSAYKELVQLQVLNPPKGLTIKLGKTTVIGSKRVNLTVKTPQNINETKYKFQVEAHSARQRIVFPFTLNVFRKQDSVKIAVDFLPRKYNARDTIDVIVGRVLPGEKTNVELSFSPLQGEKKTMTSTTDDNGVFKTPFKGMPYGLYTVGVKAKNSSNGFHILASPQDTIPRITLWTNNARRSDSLIVFGKLQPSPGIVSVNLEILGPSHLGNPDTVKVQVITNAAGEFQYLLYPVNDGLYFIKAYYLADHDKKVEGSTFALKGPFARPGIVVFIVGGRDYNYGSTAGIDNGNPHWETQNSIVKSLCRELINPPSTNPYKFVKDDIIYFNAMPFQNIDEDNDPYTDIVQTPALYVNNYTSGWLVSPGNQVTNQITAKCANLQTKVPLYIVMLGDGARKDCLTAFPKRVFRLMGNQEDCPISSNNYLDASQIVDMFCPNPCPVTNKTGIDRVFLLLSCDHAGEIAGEILLDARLPACVACNFKIATPNDTQDLIYKPDTAKEGSFEWKFFNHFLTTEATAATPDFYNCYSSANTYVLANLSPMAPRWLKPSACTDNSFSIVPH